MLGWLVLLDIFGRKGGDVRNFELVSIAPVSDQINTKKMILEGFIYLPEYYFLITPHRHLAHNINECVTSWNRCQAIYTITMMHLMTKTPSSGGMMPWWVL